MTVAESCTQHEMRPVRFTFGRHMRLSLAREYQQVYAARVSRTLGPLVVFAVPNDRAYPRLGLAVARRVGRAHERHAIKRRLREAFRMLQHDLPTGYDFVVRVRPHERLTLAEYQKLLSKAMRGLHLRWRDREDQRRG